jgi:hypothetical protein
VRNETTEIDGFAEWRLDALKRSAALRRRPARSDEIFDSRADLFVVPYRQFCAGPVPSTDSRCAILSVDRRACASTADRNDGRPLERRDSFNRAPGRQDCRGETFGLMARGIGPTAHVESRTVGFRAWNNEHSGAILQLSLYRR